MGPTWWDHEDPPEPFAVARQPRGADPLRWAADAIGQNKDLPAPQFPFDPRSLSLRNMLHSALNTSANWLDGTRDPSAVQVGPDTLAPLGLFGMGTGLANAMTRGAGRITDAKIAESLGRQFPGEIGGGTMTRTYIAGGPRMGVAGEDGMTPLTLTRGAMHTPSEFARRAPGGLSRPANDIMADNARSSAPGTVVNSGQQQEDGGIGSFLHRNFVDATVPLSSDENEWAQEIMGSRKLAKEDRLRAAEQLGKSTGETIGRWFDYLPQEQARKGIKSLLEKYGTAGPLEPVNSPANSTQPQQDSALTEILRKYGFQP